MFVVIWLFFAKQAAYKFVAPCIAWIAQRRSAIQKLELAIFLDISWVSASSVMSWCIFNTTSNYVVHYHVLFMKGWRLYSSSAKQCLLSVNRNQFLRQLKENGKAKDNVSFNKWLGILAGEDLPSKLYCSKNGDLKFSASNEEDELVYRAAVKPKSENKHGNNAKWLWNTRLIQLHKLQTACMAEKNAVSILIVR